MHTLDTIPVATAVTLAGLFRERVRRTPDQVAYRFHNGTNGEWQDCTWAAMAQQVARWQAALQQEGLAPGDRVALMVRNCREWVIFDQAALGLDLVVVPLYTNDRPDNIAYIVADAGVKLLLVEGTEQWQQLEPVLQGLRQCTRVVSLNVIDGLPAESRLVLSAGWLPGQGGELRSGTAGPDQLATIVYTSGTTGRPKGVMLSHHNILWNAASSLRSFDVYREDVFLSFLPLSHALERTLGYYLPMMAGATVAYSRSIQQLAEDLRAIRPTIIVSVPRIFERVHSRILAQLEERPPIARALFRAAVRIGWQRFQWQQRRARRQPAFLLWPLLERLVARKIHERLGGRLRLAVCGGAALSVDVAQTFIGLGLALVQGYGMTETSPVVSGNRQDDNDPASVGTPLDGVEVRIGENSELLVRGPGVMLGYWNLPDATARTIDAQGWLHTGDQARIDRGHIYITGRIKEIIVLANGEKVPPADMEMTIAGDPLFEQVMVIGEARPYLAALIVLEPELWKRLAAELNVDPDSADALKDPRVLNVVMERLGNTLCGFPGYVQIRRVALFLEPWTVENSLLTPSLKLRRHQIAAHYQEVIAQLYEGH